MSGRPSPLRFEAGLQVLAARYSFGWLVLANAVGALLAVLLLVPEWGRPLGALTYGRWVPLHLDFQLYGWCSLPCVGLLFRRYLMPEARSLFHANGLFALWSLALVAGGAGWLGGGSLGKNFLEWNGVPRLFFVGVLGLLWALLVFHRSHPRNGRAFHGWETLFLALLFLVPPALLWTTRPDVYPAIDPGTGGPTGASLLGSTLGILAIFGVVPRCLELARRGAATDRAERLFLRCYAGTLTLFLLLPHHDSSHRDAVQWLSLGTLLLWIPVLYSYFGAFHWQAASALWRGALVAWWTALVVTGFLSFLPGVLDAIKFTNVLVAHSHLAMAGMLTSFNFLLLTNLDPGKENGAAPLFEDRIAFGLWHGGLLLQLAALVGLGFQEIAHPLAFFRHEAPVGGLLLLRLGGGAAMLAASVRWLWGFAFLRV